MSKDTPRAALDPLLLQAYFDGELSAAEAADLEARLADDDALRLEALGEMRELVRFDLEQRVESVELGNLWARIERELDREAAPAAAAAPARATPAPAPNQGGWWASFKAFFSSHKVVLVPTLVAATVVGLVMVPFLLNQAPPERVVEVQKERTIVIVDEPLRFEGNSTGAVSYTPNSNTPVIWYLGEPPMDGNGGELGGAEPATVRRDSALPVPLDRLLERLERIERLVLPAPGGGGAGSGTPLTPPPVDGRSGDTTAPGQKNGPI